MRELLSFNPEELRNQTMQAYNFLAKKYANEWVNKPDQEIANRFISLINDQSKILDAGCGPAHYSRYFSNAGINCIGADLSIGMLKQAVETWSGYQLAQMDLTHLAFPNKTFDAVWACASFPHIHRNLVKTVLAQFHRVLKPDGILFINVPIGKAEYRIETVDEMGPEYGKSGRFFQYYPDQNSFLQILAGHNFTVFDTMGRFVTSKVVDKATSPSATWVNFFCRRS